MTESQWTDKPPSEPGWWWCSHNYSASDDQCVHVIDEGGSLVFYGGLFDGFLPVTSDCVTWLEPVITPDQRRQAVAAMDASETLLSNLGGCPADIADVSRVLGLLQTAIAALGGKGE